MDLHDVEAFVYRATALDENERQQLSDLLEFLNSAPVTDELIRKARAQRLPPPLMSVRISFVLFDQLEHRMGRFSEPYVGYERNPRHDKH